MPSVVIAQPPASGAQLVVSGSLFNGAYLGAGKHRCKPTPLAQAGSVRTPGPNLVALLAEFGPGFGVGDVHEGLAPVVLDFLARHTPK